MGVQAHLKAEERLFTFLDDICVICSLERVGEVYLFLEVHTGISTHQGDQTLEFGSVQTGNGGHIYAVVRNKIPEAIVWRGDPEMPSSKQGLQVLDVPMGHDDFVFAQLNQKVLEHTKLLDRIP